MMPPSIFSARGCFLRMPDSPPPVESLSAALFGQYIIQRQIGSGGMASVFLARDVKHDRNVAIKVLRSDLAANVGADRFLKEISVTASFQHPHILPLFDSGAAAGFLYYVMPFVEGESLRDRLRRERTVPIEEAVRLVSEIADALSYAHQRDIVHRDIKPENVMLSNGHAVVMDFGIARAINAASDKDDAITVTRMVVGTPAYMSPEQAFGDPTLDARSDLYSLACVLYEMLVGHRPFGDADGATLSRRLAQSPPRLRDVLPAIPSAIDTAVSTALANNPRERYANVAEFARQLREARPTETRSSDTRSSQTRRAVRREPAIAVLPFTAMGTAHDQDYFVDGITEALTSRLARLKELRVISRTSAMQFRNPQVSLPEIARRLGVDAVVEGAVLRAGERVRIHANLIDAATDRSLWSGTYERDMTDVLALQSDVALAAAREIVTTLSQEPEEEQADAAVDPESYRLYLKGRYAANKATRQGLETAVQYFRAAIDRDPTNALAYSGLGDTYTVLLFTHLLPPTEALPLAKAAAQTAIRLDNTVAEAHASLGWALVLERDWDAAEPCFLRSLELNPSYSEAHHRYAQLLIYSGRLKEAQAQLQLAVELDPLSVPITNSVGWLHYVRRDYAAAEAQLRKTLRLEPAFVNAHLILGLTLAEMGDLDGALASLGRAMSLEPENLELRLFDAFVRAKAGRRDEAKSALAAADERSAIPAEVAIVHAALGEIDAAFEWLERAVTDAPYTLLNLKLYSWYDPLRTDPRFAGLLKRMRLD
jgi:serine/threonine-protein kinase